MPYGINSNIGSLGVQRHLAISQGELNTSVNRLSSGSRINSAVDDAAGLAITDRMRARIRGDDQALRNANDSISALQTADGALSQMTDNLQRIRELAVQASNQTNTHSDRVAMQAELSQLMAANYQIGSQAEFNGQKLLDGSFSGRTLQLGAEKDDEVQINIGAAVSRQSSGSVLQLTQLYTTTETGSTVLGALSAGDLRLNGTAVGASVAGAAVLGHSAGSAWAIGNAIMAAGSSTIATATGSTTVGGNTISVPLAGASLAGGGLVINGVDVGAASGGNAAAFGAAVKAAVDGSGTGVIATANVSGNTVSFSFTSADGGDINVTGNGSIIANGSYRGKVNIATVTDLQASANLNVAGNNPLKAGFTTGLHAAIADGPQVYRLFAVTAGGEPGVSLLSTDEANAAIGYADSKLDTLGEIRTNVGALQNKLGLVVENLSTSTENLQAARSRIADTDYATETGKLTRTMILQQAGMAMLTQSNAVAENVLNLLKF